MNSQMSPLIHAKGPVYALVGVVLDRAGVPEHAPVQIQVTPGAGREYDAEFLPVFEFFKTPRGEHQVREWLAWAGGDNEFLKALLDTGAVVRVNTSDPLAAAGSLQGLRLVPQCAPDATAAVTDGLVTVKRDETSNTALLITVELARVLWGEPRLADIPTFISRIAEECQLDQGLAATRVLGDLHLLLHHGYAHLEWVDARQHSQHPFVDLASQEGTL